MTAIEPRPLRSWLFVPGDDERRITKALASAADAVILDLEDAVAVSRKADARRIVANVVESASRPGLCIRVNPTTSQECLADLEAVVRSGLASIMLAKATAARQVETIAWVIAQLEQQRGLEPGSIELLPLIETASAIVELEGISKAASRVRRLAFGAADFTADLGIEWTADEHELDMPRGQMVLVSRASGLEPPIDAPVLELRDAERMGAAAARSRNLGFGGKLCIHPAQIEPCHRAFAPTAAEIERARRIVDAFETAEARGIAAIDVDGALVDYAVAVRARRILASAQ